MDQMLVIGWQMFAVAGGVQWHGVRCVAGVGQKVSSGSRPARQYVRGPSLVYFSGASWR
jgi:hypothetical protein